MENKDMLQNKFYKAGELDNITNIGLPSVSLTDALLYGSRIINLQQSEFSDSEKEVITNIADGSKLSMLNDATTSINSKDMVSEIVGSRDGVPVLIKPKKLNLKSNASGKALIIDKINQTMDIGQRVKIPLYHSGFWIAMNPPKADDISKLILKLNNAKISISRASRTLLHTSSKIILEDIIIEFILSRVFYTSLKIPAGVPITKYISIFDKPSLIMAVVASMYPNGHNFTINCKNTHIRNKKKISTKCDFTTSGVVDVLETLVVDKSRMTQFMIDTLSKDGKDMVSVSEIERYKQELDDSNDENYNLKVAIRDEELTMRMKHPNIYYYHKDGKKWLSQILDKVDRLLETEVADRDKVISDVIFFNNCNTYKGFITSVKMGDDTNIKDDEIEDVLVALSGSKETQKAFNKVVRRCIERSSISIFGFSNYICPKCQEKQIEDLKDHPWNTVLPIDPYEYFLELSVSKISNLQ